MVGRIAIEANGQKLQIPICWEAVTVDQFQKLYTSGELDNLKAFSILSGLNVDKLQEETREDLDAAVYQCTAFIFTTEQTFRNIPVPSSIRIAGRLVVLPKKVSALTIGQNFHVRQAMVRATTQEELIAFTTAVFLQPIVDGTKFDIDMAKELEAEILQMNIFDVFPIGFFYLSKLNSYGRSGLLSWLPTIQRKINNVLTYHS